LSNIFKIAAILIAVFYFSCAPVIRRDNLPSDRTRSGEILSLHLLNSAGPELGDGVTLVDPAAVCVNALGEIFISDRATNTISKLSPELTLQAHEGGISGTGGGFNRPLGMASDAALNLYIADSGNRRIQVFDHNLHYIKSISSYFNENDETVEFTLPGDLSFDSEGNIWVADDTKAEKIDPFSRLVLEISDKAPGYFIIGRISALDVSRRGQLAVADIGNQKILLSSIYGNYIGKFDVPSPVSLVWDNDDLWTTDPQSGKISAFDARGFLLFSYPGDEPGFRPIWAKFDPSGRLIVIDRGVRKIKVYEVVRGGGASGSK
jgi:tripartite motif-containing protein 71